MCVTDRHDMTLAVKVALNPNTTNQPTNQPVQCKKPPFTNTMFIDRSKFQEQFWKGSLKEHFYEIISKSDQ